MRYNPGNRVVRISEHHYVFSQGCTFDDESQQYDVATVINNFPLNFSGSQENVVRVRWDKGGESSINIECLQMIPPMIEEDPF